MPHLRIYNAAAPREREGATVLARVMQSLVFTTPNFIHKDLVHETERIAPRVKITQTTFTPIYASLAPFGFLCERGQT